MDPRTKIFGLLSIFIISMSFNHPVYLLTLFLFIITAVILSKSMINIFKFRLVIILLFLFCSVLWPLFLRRGLKSVLYGIGMGIRLDVMIVAGILFLSTTMIEELCWGLKKFGLPYPISFALSMAFRLVPTFLGTTSTVVQAQRSRGLDLESGNIIKRVKKYVPLIIPIFVSAIRNTDNLSMALEGKGFTPHRTYYIDSKLRFWDYLIFFSFGLLVTLFIYLRIKGYGVILEGRL